MDYLDFIRQDKTEEVLTGTYYSRRPKTCSDVGITFNYDVIEDSDKSFSTLLNNVEAVVEMQTIKTTDLNEVKIKAYIVTQDGNMWQIRGAIKGVVNKNSKQALRLLKETNQTAYTIRLVKVENPWGLR